MAKIRTIVSDVRLSSFIIMLILVTILLVQNTGTIQVNFLVLKIQIPTVILIMIVALVGFVGGYLFAIWFRRQQ